MTNAKRESLTMKTLLIIISIFACLSTKAQDTSKFRFPLTTDHLNYQDVITLDSTYSQSLLYKSVKTWFVNSFKSVKSVIQSEDQINGRFLGKAEVIVPAGMLIYGSVAPQIIFYIQIDVKKGKYRYKFYNFSYAFYDFNNNLVERPFEPGYNLYLENKTLHGLAIGRDNLNRKITDAYISMQTQLNGLIANLFVYMKNSKADEF